MRGRCRSSVRTPALTWACVVQHGMFALLNDARASIRAHVSTILTGEEQMENTVAGFGERRAPTPATKPVRPRRAPRSSRSPSTLPPLCR